VSGKRVGWMVVIVTIGVLYVAQTVYSWRSGEDLFDRDGECYVLIGDQDRGVNPCTGVYRANHKRMPGVVKLFLPLPESFTISVDYDRNVYLASQIVDAEFDCTGVPGSPFYHAELQDVIPLSSISRMSNLLAKRGKSHQNIPHSDPGYPDAKDPWGCGGKPTRLQCFKISGGNQFVDYPCTTNISGRVMVPSGAWWHSTEVNPRDPWRRRYMKRRVYKKKVTVVMLHKYLHINYSNPRPIAPKQRVQQVAYTEYTRNACGDPCNMGKATVTVGKLEKAEFDMKVSTYGQRAYTFCSLYPDKLRIASNSTGWQWITYRGSRMNPIINLNFGNPNTWKGITRVGIATRDRFSDWVYVSDQLDFDVADQWDGKGGICYWITKNGTVKMWERNEITKRHGPVKTLFTRANFGGFSPERIGGDGQGNCFILAEKMFPGSGFVRKPLSNWQPSGKNKRERLVLWYQNVDKGLYKFDKKKNKLLWLRAFRYSGQYYEALEIEDLVTGKREIKNIKPETKVDRSSEVDLAVLSLAGPPKHEGINQVDITGVENVISVPPSAKFKHGYDVAYEDVEDECVWSFENPPVWTGKDRMGHNENPQHEATDSNKNGFVGGFTFNVVNKSKFQPKYFWRLERIGPGLKKFVVIKDWHEVSKGKPYEFRFRFLDGGYYMLYLKAQYYWYDYETMRKNPPAYFWDRDAYIRGPYFAKAKDGTIIAKRLILVQKKPPEESLWLYVGNLYGIDEKGQKTLLVDDKGNTVGTPSLNEDEEHTYMLDRILVKIAGGVDEVAEYKRKHDPSVFTNPDKFDKADVVDLFSGIDESTLSLYWDFEEFKGKKVGDPSIADPPIAKLDLSNKKSGQFEYTLWTIVPKSQIAGKGEAYPDAFPELNKGKPLPPGCTIAEFKNIVQKVKYITPNEGGSPYDLQFKVVGREVGFEPVKLGNPGEEIIVGYEFRTKNMVDISRATQVTVYDITAPQVTLVSPKVADLIPGTTGDDYIHELIFRISDNNPFAGSVNFKIFLEQGDDPDKDVLEFTFNNEPMMQMPLYSKSPTQAFDEDENTYYEIGLQSLLKDNGYSFRMPAGMLNPKAIKDDGKFTIMIVAQDEAGNSTMLDSSGELTFKEDEAHNANNVGYDGATTTKPLKSHPDLCEIPIEMKDNDPPEVYLIVENGGKYWHIAVGDDDDLNDIGFDSRFKSSPECAPDLKFKDQDGQDEEEESGNSDKWPQAVKDSIDRSGPTPKMIYGEAWITIKATSLHNISGAGQGLLPLKSFKEVRELKKDKAGNEEYVIEIDLTKPEFNSVFSETSPLEILEDTRTRFILLGEDNVDDLEVEGEMKCELIDKSSKKPKSTTTLSLQPIQVNSQSGTMILRNPSPDILTATIKVKDKSGNAREIKFPLRVVDTKMKVHTLKLKYNFGKADK